MPVVAVQASRAASYSVATVMTASPGANSSASWNAPSPFTSCQTGAAERLYTVNSAPSKVASPWA